jgi:hypothetical protein
LTLSTLKPHHAAALALLVWYLMLPPFLKKNQFGIWHADPNAPLSKWNFYNERNDFTAANQAHALEFKAYDECERKRKEIYDDWFGTNGHRGLKDILEPTKTVIDARTELVTYEKCIASDDRRALHIDDQRAMVLRAPVSADTQSLSPKSVSCELLKSRAVGKAFTNRS